MAAVSSLLSSKFSQEFIYRTLRRMWHIVIYRIHVLSNHIIKDNLNVLFWPSIWQFMIGKIWACLSECTMMRERHIGFVLGWNQRTSSYFMLKTSPCRSKMRHKFILQWVSNKYPKQKCFFLAVSISARFHVHWRRRLCSPPYRCSALFSMLIKLAMSVLIYR